MFGNGCEARFRAYKQNLQGRTIQWYQRHPAQVRHSSAVPVTSYESYAIVEGSVTCDKCPVGQKVNGTGDGCEVCPNGKYSNPGSTSCSNCDETPGYVSLSGETGAAACEYCGPGFYADQASHTCKECEIDSYSVGGVNECTSCPSGTNNAVASTSCSPCSPGNIPTGTSCDLCEKGKYGEFGATSCAPCDGDGQYADELGLAACKTAPAGMKPTSDRHGTENCSPGRYSVGGKTECDECEIGKFSNEGAVGCSQCEPGEVPVGNTCESCEVGKYSKFGSSACLSCEDGFYSSEPGSSTCFTCTPGKFTNDDQTECLFCHAGKISGVAASSCSVCEEGKYAEGEGNTECQFCDDDEMLVGSITLHNGTTSASGCICPAGE